MNSNTQNHSNGRSVIGIELKKTKIYKKFHIKIENMSSIPISYFEYHIISLNEEVLEPIKLGFKENDKF